jgi:hypothetical protein
MICGHSAWSAAAAPVLFVWVMFYNRAGSRQNKNNPAAEEPSSG